MRRLFITIFRYDPSDPESVPTYQDYVVDELPRMSIYQALDEIQTKIDPSLYYDVVCRSNVCGSCAININGRPLLACRTQTSELPEKILLEPLVYFPLIKDLSTNKGGYFMDLNRELEAWIHTDKGFDPEMENIITELAAQEVYETDRCIECGICMEACGVTKLNPDYLGAAGLNKVLHFMIDERDNRGVKGMLRYADDDNGAFGCEAMLGCRDLCPKDIELLKIIAKVRNRVVKQVVCNTLRGMLRRKRT
ncbi:fumarate reductase iron-sulfur subunit [bacterium]|nr:fumarate reductase iron-sulfur subunit [candidate division CSSED10-310 bacterium]